MPNVPFPFDSGAVMHLEAFVVFIVPMLLLLAALVFNIVMGVVLMTDRRGNSVGQVTGAVLFVLTIMVVLIVTTR